MTTLPKELRRQLERIVLQARDEAERGAAAALDGYGVGEPRKPGFLDKSGEDLRKKLRAHGRQVGDLRRPDESQEVEHLKHECAYEHWHRMLFARFLAENGFLIEPESGLDVDLEFCEERARELQTDKWEVAAEFAQRMLPGVFRPDNPVLRIKLPTESRTRLSELLASLPREVFLADDSLGWVYQFWQTKRKEQINDSDDPRGADEIPAVTQLFTEDYMVEFLLQNTLGAWWTAKRKAEGKSQPVAFPYLRLKEDGTPAAGTFAGWPKTVKELRVLDPCMGSGHFLVFALIMLVRMRMEEEGLSACEACAAVLRENLFGLELDPRCTQIAAFNLAFAAWKLGGHHAELTLNVACSGLGLHTKKEDWLKLAERAAQTSALAPDSDLLGTREETLLSQKLKAGMERLYSLFQRAPVLGSLINPRALGGDMLIAEFHDLQPVLEKALQRETGEDAHELAVTAQGVAKAAEILAGQFTLVTTNVPYLGRGKQDDVLKDYLDRAFPDSKWDLATAFMERCESLCKDNGTVALVTPQQWCFGDKYIAFRDATIRQRSWDFLARLGTNAFETISGEVVNVILYIVSRSKPSVDRRVQALDVSDLDTPEEKQKGLYTCGLMSFSQLGQLKNPDFRVTLRDPTTQKLLGSVAKSTEGLSAGDGERFIHKFWELPQVDDRWEFLQSAPEESKLYCGVSDLVLWEDGKGDMARSPAARVRGHSAWRKPGIVVAKMNSVRAAVYLGGLFAKNCAVLSVANAGTCPAVLEFVTSMGFEDEVSRLDANLNTATSVFEKVPFDLEHWQRQAAEKYPHGLPKPFSSDPTQWLFNGNPKGSDHPLQVAVARLVGYRWPRQTSSSFPGCPSVGPDGLEKHADNDGIVCFSQSRDEAPAAERLRALLADAYGQEWTHAMERKLIADTGSRAESLEEWLLNDFFEQHCEIFQNRPFVWHIWDGRKDGFNVLVNYHKLTGPRGEGYRVLETLIYAYLTRDWIERQRDAVKQQAAGAEGRLAAALELKLQLESILVGEPPYDLFIRWKPLDQQPIGWQPDINDGVRLNIRPFAVAVIQVPQPTRNDPDRKKDVSILRLRPGISWEKGRGKEPFRPKEAFPWFWAWDERAIDFQGNGEFDANRWNDCHYTTAFKRAAREKKANG